MPYRPVTERPKGVVDPAAAALNLRLARYLPEPPFDAWLDHYWVVEWALAAPREQRTLPFPCVNVVFDAGQSGCFGVVTRAFAYRQEGTKRALGLRFRPGAFRALLGEPVHRLTDKVRPLAPVFGFDGAAAERAVLGAPGDEGMIDAANALLAPLLPAPAPEVERICALLARVQADAGITRAEQMAEHAGMALRTLQGLFREFVGVSPKWVIKRYRLHEAADRLAAGTPVDLAQLAAALGYYDQAHFSADFQHLVGVPPSQYRRNNSAA
jgi:AraC-like DNA-binding protein